MNNFLNIKFENHKVPEFKEVKNKRWVFFGDDNMYCEYLIELSLRSSTHGAILKGKSGYVAGMGIGYSSKGASLQSQALANEFIRQINADNFYEQIISDFELFNGFFIEPIYNKAGNKLKSINYIPFNKMRVAPDESVYFYSNDWKIEKGDNPEKTGYKEFKPFDENNIQSNQLFYFKVLSAKNGKEKNVYPTPSYIGCTTSIETEIEIDNYHFNNVRTGWSVGTLLSFNNGVPTEEAKEEIEKAIKNKFQGTDRAGSVAITFNNSAENAPTITSFTPSDLDKQFITIGDRVRQSIFSGHRISSPTLFGVATAGTLGQRNEMIDAYELFQNTYVAPRQQMIEEVLNLFGRKYGLTCKLEIKKVQAVLTGLTDSQINGALTPQEVRERLGLAPLKENKNDKAKDIINAINSLSPLVANKVLESMSQEEIRSLVGLTGTTAEPLTQTSFVKEEIYEVLFEREWNNETDEDAILEFNKMNFKSELTANERAIIDLLTKDELTPSDAIAKVLKISEAEVNKLIDKLNAGGYLDGTTATTSGLDVVYADGAKTGLIEVKYKYDWRPNVTPDNNARDFCKEMLSKHGASQSGWLTRSEIENLDNGQDLPVWDSRGGWWNKGGVSVPFCRHNWFQMVVKKK